MAINAKISGATRGLSVTLTQNKPPLSIKGTAKVTRLDQLADVNSSLTQESNATGATILYDAEAGTFVFKKIADYDNETGDVTFNAGEF